MMSALQAPCAGQISCRRCVAAWLCCCVPSASQCTGWSTRHCATPIVILTSLQHRLQRVQHALPPAGCCHRGHPACCSRSLTLRTSVAVLVSCVSRRLAQLMLRRERRLRYSEFAAKVRHMCVQSPVSLLALMMQSRLEHFKDLPNHSTLDYHSHYAGLSCSRSYCPFASPLSDLRTTPVSASIHNIPTMRDGVHHKPFYLISVTNHVLTACRVCPVQSAGRRRPRVPCPR